MVTKEGGPHERDPEGTGKPRYKEPPTMGPAEDAAEIIKLQGAPDPDSLGPNDDDVDHMTNWLDSMRDRKQPNATVDHGFSHSIACIMAAQSYWSGKRLYWKADTEEITDQRPA